MRSAEVRHLIAVGTLVAGAATAVAACSSAGTPGPATPADSAAQPAAESINGPIGLSPGGVTTRIDVPAQSTEEQYAQACLAAKEWMGVKGGDPHTLVEPYLKEIQASPDSGPATFRKNWAELTEAQRAGVIIAVRAAADGGC